MTLKTLAALTALAGLSTAVAAGSLEATTGYTGNVSDRSEATATASWNASTQFLSQSLPNFISGLDEASTRGTVSTKAESTEASNVVSQNNRVVERTPSQSMSGTTGNASNYVSNVASSSVDALSGVINWIGETFMTQSATDWSSRVVEITGDASSKLSVESKLDATVDATVERLASSYNRLAVAARDSELSSTRGSQSSYQSSAELAVSAKEFISNVGDALVATSEYGLNLSQGASMEVSASGQTVSEGAAEIISAAANSQSNSQMSGVSVDQSLSQISDASTRLYNAVLAKRNYSKNDVLARDVRAAVRALRVGNATAAINTVTTHYVVMGNDLDTAAKAALIEIAATAKLASR